MLVNARLHAGHEGRFHVLRRIGRAGRHRQRPDLSDPLAADSAPIGFGDGEQPYLAERLDDGATQRLGLFRRTACGIDIKMPIDRPSWEHAERRLGDNPAAHIRTSLGDWLAALRHRLVTHRDPGDEAGGKGGHKLDAKSSCSYAARYPALDHHEDP